MKKQVFFNCLRYGGLLVTAAGAVVMLTPGAWAGMLKNVAAYMIFGGRLLNTTGRMKTNKNPAPTTAAICRAIAECLQDIALFL